MYAALAGEIILGQPGRLDGIDNDVQLAEYLLNEAEVALVPGSAFGQEGYLRISFATSMDNLSEALERIEQALK